MERPRSAYLIFGLFGFFFQAEQCFSLTTIQPEQCFSASFSQNSVSRTGPGWNNEESIALFAWLISHTFSANEQYFSLTTNQSTVLSTMAYQPSEQGNFWNLLV